MRVGFTYTIDHHTEAVLSHLNALPRPPRHWGDLISFGFSDSADESGIWPFICNSNSLSRVIQRGFTLAMGLRDRQPRLEEIVACWGIQGVRDFLLLAELVEMLGFVAVQPIEGLDVKLFWRRNLAVAIAARQLATACSAPSGSRLAHANQISPNEAFDAGVLHDLGIAALAWAFPKSYGRALRRSRRNASSLLDAEESIFGTAHTAIGGRVAAAWKLPDRIARVAELHHQPVDMLDPVEDRLVLIIKLAATLVRDGGHTPGSPLNNSEPAGPIAKRLALDSEILEASKESFASEIRLRSRWADAAMRLADELPDILDLSNRSTRRSLLDPSLHVQNCLETCRWIGTQDIETASLERVCALAAEAVRRALGRRGAVVLLCRSDRSGVLFAWSEGANQEFAFLDRDAGYRFGDPRDEHDDGEVGLPRRAAPEVESLLSHHRLRMDPGALLQIPIAGCQNWKVAAFVGAGALESAGWQAEQTALHALCVCLAMLVTDALARAGFLRSSDRMLKTQRDQDNSLAVKVARRTLEAIRGMASGAAHELNNPLAVIAGRAQMLRNGTMDEEMRTQLESISRQAQAASMIVTDLMEFAESRPPVPKSVALADLFSRLSAGLTDEGLLAAGGLECDIPSDTPPVWFDPEYLERLFRELLLNAVEATPGESRRLTVKIAPRRTEESVVVHVADNGCGMTPEVLDQAATPFYSWRPAGRGRGLGLARVTQWLADGGGSLELASTPGAGTRATVRLPIARMNG